MKRLLQVRMVLALAFVFAASAVGIAQSGGSTKDNDFKGFYVGGYVGGALGKSHTRTTTIFSPTGYFATTSVPAIATVGNQHPDSNGFTIGGDAGYNWQHNNFVGGAEFDFGYMGLSESKTGTAPYPCCPTTNFTVKQKVETDWLLTVRPRLGFTVSKALIYGTAGLAVTNLNYRPTFTDTFATAAESARLDENKVGWTAGGGVEFKVHQHWTAKGEYLYADFGDDKKTSTNLTAFTPPIAFPSNVFTHRVDLQTHIFRFGFNYRF